jgi:hypothetical protein
VLAGQAQPGPRTEARDAQRQALAVHLAALGVIAEQRPLLFRPEAFAPLAPRAGAARPAVEAIGAALQAAQAANPDPVARANSAGAAAAIEDLRLRPFLLATDAPVQVVVAALAEGATDPSERAVLARIGEGHALLGARARSVVRLGQRETSREIRDAEEALLRAAARLPAGEAVAARAVAAAVQP